MNNDEKVRHHGAFYRERAQATSKPLPYERVQPAGVVVGAASSQRPGGRGSSRT